MKNLKQIMPQNDIEARNEITYGSVEIGTPAQVHQKRIDKLRKLASSELNVSSTDDKAKLINIVPSNKLQEKFPPKPSHNHAKTPKHGRQYSVSFDQENLSENKDISELLEEQTQSTSLIEK